MGTAFARRRHEGNEGAPRRVCGRGLLLVVPLAIAAVLAAAPSALAGTTVVNVPAKGQGAPPSWTFWTSSGVTLAAGRQAVVTATGGAWGICQPFAYGCPLTSLNGAGGMGTGTWSSAYGSFVPGSLIGSLDGTHWFEIGAGPKTVTGPGTLLLAMWDVPTDYSGYYNNAGSMDVQIATVDTTPPALSLPGDVTAEATGPGGAAVSYDASATDDVDGAVTPACSPASGSTFALGTTEVDCTATDAAGNQASGSFSVTVQDTTAPALSLPADVTAEATGPGGVTVSYEAAATDLVDGAVTPICSPASGSTFALGTTEVDCTATDAAGNQASGSFTVTVQDTTAPTVTASLVRVGHGGDDESTQLFRVELSVSDGVGVASLTADLNGVTVHDGQLVLLQVATHGRGFVLLRPILHIRAASFTLTATATDAAGNSATATATPTFVTHGRDEGREGRRER